MSCCEREALNRTEAESLKQGDGSRHAPRPRWRSIQRTSRRPLPTLGAPLLGQGTRVSEGRGSSSSQLDRARQGARFSPSVVPEVVGEGWVAELVRAGWASRGCDRTRWAPQFSCGTAAAGPAQRSASGAPDCRCTRRPTGGPRQRGSRRDRLVDVVETPLCQQQSTRCMAGGCLPTVIVVVGSCEVG